MHSVDLFWRTIIKSFRKWLTKNSSRKLLNWSNNSTTLVMMMPQPYLQKWKRTLKVSEKNYGLLSSWLLKLSSRDLFTLNRFQMLATCQLNLNQMMNLHSTMWLNSVWTSTENKLKKSAKRQINNTVWRKSLTESLTSWRNFRSVQNPIQRQRLTFWRILTMPSRFWMTTWTLFWWWNLVLT